MPNWARLYRAAQAVAAGSLYGYAERRQAGCTREGLELFTVLKMVL
jgi:hypothetical protein